jgi:hypothetical protein
MGLDFDGSSMRIDIPYARDTVPLTMMAWVNMDVNNTSEMFFSMFQAGQEYQLSHVNATSGIQIERGAAPGVNTGYVMSVDTWYHVIAAIDGTSTILYVNGASQHTGAAGANNAGNNFRLGEVGAGSSGQRLNGTMWDARVYSRKITAAEAKIIYESRGSDNITNGLEFRCLMNEKPTGSTATGASSVIDLSSNGRHGTPVGSPVYTEESMKIVR